MERKWARQKAKRKGKEECIEKGRGQVKNRKEKTEAEKEGRKN